MKTRQYKTDIKAPASRVMKTMIAEKTYKLWTAPFSPSSSFEGAWEKGNHIRFIGVDENGVKGGMIAEVMDIIPAKFVSLRHYGMVSGDTIITEGPEVEGWQNARENYSFAENNGITTVTIDIDVMEDHLDFFDKTWPMALDKLKELSEQ